MKLEIDVPDSAFSVEALALAKDIDELAGQSRHEYLAGLSRLGVSPFQGVEDDLSALEPRA